MKHDRVFYTVTLLQLTFPEGSLDLLNLSVGTSAEYLNQDVLISPRPLHRSAETLCIIECLWFHQSHNGTLKIARQL